MMALFVRDVLRYNSSAQFSRCHVAYTLQISCRLSTFINITVVQCMELGVDSDSGVDYVAWRGDADQTVVVSDLT